MEGFMMFLAVLMFILIIRSFLMSAEMDRLNLAVAALGAKVDAVVAMPKGVATAAEVDAASVAVEAANTKLDSVLVGP